MNLSQGIRPEPAGRLSLIPGDDASLRPSYSPQDARHVPCPRLVTSFAALRLEAHTDLTERLLDALESLGRVGRGGLGLVLGPLECGHAVVQAAAPRQAEKRVMATPQPRVCGMGIPLASGLEREGWGIAGVVVVRLSGPRRRSWRPRGRRPRRRCGR